MRLVKSLVEIGVKHLNTGDWIVTPDDLMRIAFYTEKRCKTQHEIPVYDRHDGGPVLGYLYAINLRPPPPADPKILLGMMDLTCKVDSDRLVQAKILNFLSPVPELIGIILLSERATPDNRPRQPKNPKKMQRIIVP